LPLIRGRGESSIGDKIKHTKKGKKRELLSGSLGDEGEKRQERGFRGKGEEKGGSGGKEKTSTMKREGT